jgi:hypothetical protein
MGEAPAEDAANIAAAKIKVDKDFIAGTFFQAGTVFKRALFLSRALPFKAGIFF